MTRPNQALYDKEKNNNIIFIKDSVCRAALLHCSLMCFCCCAKTSGRNYSRVYTETKSHNNKQVFSKAEESCASETSLVILFFHVVYQRAVDVNVSSFLLPPLSQKKHDFSSVAQEPKAELPFCVAEIHTVKNVCARLHMLLSRLFYF